MPTNVERRRHGALSKAQICFASLALLLFWRWHAYDEFWHLNSWVISTDREVYERLFMLMQEEGIAVALERTSGIEVGFFLLLWPFSLHTNGFEIFILLNEGLVIFSLVLLCSSTSKDVRVPRVLVLAVAFTSISAFMFFTPFFQSYSNNVLRQSLSYSLFLLSLHLCLRKKLVGSFLLWMASALIHIPTALLSLSFYVSALLVLRLDVRKTTFIVVFVLSLGFYMAGMFDGLFVLLVGVIDAVWGKAKGLYEVGSYVTGFKLTFALASIVGAVAAFGAPICWRRKSSSVLAGSFVLLSLAYMLLSGMPYYDRVALLSWFLVPVLLVHLACSIYDRIRM